jgi:polyisoprenoid-binding protein YceI
MFKTVRSGVLVLALAALPASAETFDLDPTHTSVMYSLNHLGFSTSKGFFREVRGSLVLDEASPEAGRLEVVVKTASVDAFDAGRSNAVKGDKFLDVEHFPEMRFVSTKIERTGSATAKVTGDLSLHGITRPVTLDVALVKKGKHPITGAQRGGFSATGMVKRSDFKILGFLPMVGDDVTITIDAEFGAS